MQLKLKNKDVNIKLIELYVIYKLKKIFLFTGENRIKLKHENLNTLSKKKKPTQSDKTSFHIDIDYFHQRQDTGKTFSWEGHAVYPSLIVFQHYSDCCCCCLSFKIE